MQNSPINGGYYESTDGSHYWRNPSHVGPCVFTVIRPKPTGEGRYGATECCPNSPSTGSSTAPSTANPGSAPTTGLTAGQGTGSGSAGGGGGAASTGAGGGDGGSGGGAGGAGL